MEKRNKAEFKALRESVGLTQQALADMLGVQVRSVKRWEAENEEGYYDPPVDAWDIIDVALERQRIAVETALDLVDEMGENLGEPAAIELLYWLAESDYRTYSTDASNDMIGDWRMANANARAVAAVLRAEGFEVRFRNGAGGVAKP